MSIRRVRPKVTLARIDRREAKLLSRIDRLQREVLSLRSLKIQFQKALASNIVSFKDAFKDSSENTSN